MNWINTLIFFSFLLIFNISAKAQTGSCGDPQEICSTWYDGVPYSGTTIVGGPTTPNPWAAAGCGGAVSVENSQWYTFVANCPSLDVTITFGSCEGNGQGIQWGFFETEDCVSFTCLQGAGNANSNSTVNVTLNNLVVGNDYLFVIDGFAGSVCGFTLEVDPCNGGILDPSADGILGETQACPGSTFTYCLDNPLGVQDFIDGKFFDGGKQKHSSYSVADVA